MNTPATLLTRRLTKTFGSLVALSSIDAKFEQGFRYGIMGVSGSGKSTLLYILAGLDKPTAGTIFYNDRDLGLMAATEQQDFLNNQIGIVLQYPYLINELSVLENVILKGLACGVSYKKAAEQGEELLASMGIADKIKSAPTALSGGQQQRVALARALFNRPKFLFADEPTAHLDVHTKHEILELIDNYCKNKNMGLVLTTHDKEVTRHMDTVLYLSNGQLHEFELQSSNIEQGNYGKKNLVL